MATAATSMSRRIVPGERRLPRGWGRGWVHTKGFVHWVWRPNGRPNYPLATLEHLTDGWVLYLCAKPFEAEVKAQAQKPKDLLPVFVAWRLEHGI